MWQPSVGLVFYVLGEPELRLALDAGSLHRFAQLVGGGELLRTGDVVDAEGDDDDVGVVGVAVEAVGGHAGLPTGSLVVIEYRLPGGEVGDAVLDEHAGQLILLLSRAVH